MSFEIIAGLVVVILGAIAGAFGIGHARGACKAEAKTEQHRTEENSAARIAAAERKVAVRLKPRELKLCAAWLSPAPKFRKTVSGHTAH